MRVKESEHEVITIEMSHLDYLIIENVKRLRSERGLSQIVLTQLMGLSEGFIGKVELYTNRTKYNIRHIHLLAKALQCSIQEILPEKQPEYDIVRLTLKRSNKRNKDGRLSPKKSTEILKIEPVK